MSRNLPAPKDLRLGRAKLIADCVDKLQADGWEVFKRGFPTIAAVKDCQMRFIVVNPLVSFGPVVLGSGKDDLADAFYRCFGVKYEIWENPEDERQGKRWI